MTGAELKTIRELWGLTQTQMANELDMTLRGYQKLEADGEELRKVYIYALAYMSMARAAAAARTRAGTVEVPADTAQILFSRAEEAEMLNDPVLLALMINTPRENEIVASFEATTGRRLTSRERAAYIHQVRAFDVDRSAGQIKIQTD